MCLRRNIFCHAKSIYEIDVDFYVSLGIKHLLVDLDNTLDSYKLYTPTQKAFDLKATLDKHGIELIIISNNRGKRVKSYAEALGVPYLASSRKPFAGKINKFISLKNIDKSKALFVGDQMLTDMGAANKTNIRAVLTDKIVKEDQWTTHFNRLFDRPMRKRYAKKGKLIDWRTIYGKS